uniref:T9SS type A sorting domain-containing protein n=1 Tax=Flavobacterium sp. TaxID=239 RepID=UPI004049091F
MKKMYFLFLFTIYFNVHAQCPAPSDITIMFQDVTQTQLSWTENGNANTWEILVIPDYQLESPLSSFGYITVASNELYTILNVPNGCIIYFIRSVCSETEKSDWAYVATSNCPDSILENLANLLNNDISLLSNKSSLNVFPNPTKSILQLQYDKKIDKITILDLTGKVVLKQTHNTNAINVAQLSNGIYVIKIEADNQEIFQKFIKD